MVVVPARDRGGDGHPAALAESPALAGAGEEPNLPLPNQVLRAKVSAWPLSQFLACQPAPNRAGGRAGPSRIARAALGFRVAAIRVYGQVKTGPGAATVRIPLPSTIRRAGMRIQISGASSPRHMTARSCQSSKTDQQIALRRD